MSNMSIFSFMEDFSALNEKKLPMGLWVEDNSIYTHHHVRSEERIFYITCRGNHYFCKTPALYTFSTEIHLGFHNTEHGAGYKLLFGYDRDLRTGYILDFWLDNGRLSAMFAYTDKLHLTPIQNETAPYARNGEHMYLKASSDGKMLTIAVDEISWNFLLPSTYRPGLVGLTFTGHIGELAVYDIRLESSDTLMYESITSSKTVTVPLRNGGTMPYTLQYELVKYGELHYLRYILDGGVQNRERYSEYPRITGQYWSESDQIFDPYLVLYQANVETVLEKVPLYKGDFTVMDPAMHWRVLRSYWNVRQLPISGMIVLEKIPEIQNLQIGFGYANRVSDGFHMQIEENMEFVYDFLTGSPIYEGKAPEFESIQVFSNSVEVLKRIPESVYDYEAVESHLKNNHFFAEFEEPVFTVSVATKRNKAFITVHAELQDVYGDHIDDMQKTVEGTATVFTCKPLHVGVYRICFTAYYGDTEILKREVVFEVCDPEGLRCPPLESGLPFLYSMPNEQKYLDRDAFDLYNPVPDCNMEHYYACSSMTGDIGVKKRIWETNRVFGRKWYVWNSPHRTMTQEEFDQYGEEILRRSDYCYYPVPTEWAVMRHDLAQTIAYNGTGMMKHLYTFLHENPQFNIIGVDDTCDSITPSQLGQFLSVALQPWLEYANEQIEKENRDQTVWLRTINPSIKRACYGPFPIYGGPITTHHSCLYVGSQPKEGLALNSFDGFAQLEDYPYSCSYHTYQGACFVMHTLLHHPGLSIYPEEYTASRGGCVDGAVKDANPPLGRYDMPTYFNVTHAYEYVYNTAHLTSDGFRYWNSYGFMQRDFTEEFVDAFVKGWKNVVKHKPAHPLRTTAYLSEISGKEDKWIERSSGQWISNRSNTGLAYMYETCRMAGLPNGFAVTYETLMSLTPEMTDCIILPSMCYAPEEVLLKIRNLYEQGIALVAVGDVTGLEDLFGVVSAVQEVTILKLINRNEEERIFPDTAEFLYQPASSIADVVLWAEDKEKKRYPAVICGKRTCLINASVDELGHRSYGNHPNFVAANISKLMRSMLCDTMRHISTPIVSSDYAGITILKDVNGDTLLLAIDYSDYDLAEEKRTWQSEICFHTDEFTNIETLYGEKPIRLISDGILKGISLKLHQQECALFKLIRK